MSPEGEFMKTLFRTVVALLLFAPVFTVQIAQAQSWPNKPIRLVVPFSAGGNTDIVARLFAQELSKTLGQPVVVENKPGASGNIGADAVAKSAPDGYTLVMGTVGTHAINASLYKKMPYDAIKDFAPVTLLASVPNVLVVPVSLPVKSVKELVAYGKANPGKLSFASSGVGTSIHLSGEMFRTTTGIDMTHIAYKGSAPAVTDLIAAQVQLMFDNLPTSLQYVKTDKLRALAVTTAKRIEALPDVPTMIESGFPGFETGSWFGVFAPAATPKDIIARLNTELLKIAQTPEMQQKLLQSGAEPVGKGSEEFTAYVRSETTKWAKVVKDSGATAD
jgi:tripartite-type tricarboxylate transporter receptor subunit TctC